jgi:saccharopine dehydrogenase (NAD+, L-lysine forming)
MIQYKLGVIKEGKVPPDKRVPLTPEQCILVQKKFPNVKVIVQPSPIRCFSDKMYLDAGIEMNNDLTNCDILLGIKEVKVEDLIPNKKYLFFSHTFKKQPYNRGLLQAVLDKNIQLIDYEILKNLAGKRLIGFGRYAGIVGCYNGFRLFGLKHNLYAIKPANECHDRVELEQELKKVILPSNTKIVLTGFGRVGHGAREILDLLPIHEVSPEEYLTGNFPNPVFTQLEAEDYYKRKDNKSFEKADFYKNGTEYTSKFSLYANTSDMYVACHYWANSNPVILDAAATKVAFSRMKVISDVSCDIDGPIAATIRSSSIQAPFFGYDPETGLEIDPMNEKAMAIMAVDNLPCELPKDASEDFGNELLKHILSPLFEEDPDKIISRGSETTLDGNLTDSYKYLENYLKGKE